MSTAHVYCAILSAHNLHLAALPCQMSEEGISACYVNSHSFVHDIVTLSQVRGGGCGWCVGSELQVSPGMRT